MFSAKCIICRFSNKSMFYASKNLKVNVRKKVPYHPQQLLKPCNAGFCYFCKRKKENQQRFLVRNPQQDQHFVNLCYNLLESTRKKKRGKKKKKNTHEETKKWESGGVHCASSKDEYLKGNSGFLSLGLRNYGGAFPICCNLDICNWKRNLPELTSVKHSALTGD